MESAEFWNNPGTGPDTVAIWPIFISVAVTPGPLIVPVPPAPVVVEVTPAAAVVPDEAAVVALLAVVVAVVVAALVELLPQPAIATKAAAAPAVAHHRAFELLITDTMPPTPHSGAKWHPTLVES
jgi:hypothetical protein